MAKSSEKEKDYTTPLSASHFSARIQPFPERFQFSKIFIQMLNSARSSLHSLCPLQHEDEGFALAAVGEARQRLTEPDIKWSEPPENEGRSQERDLFCFIHSIRCL